MAPVGAMQHGPIFQTGPGRPASGRNPQSESAVRASGRQELLQWLPAKFTAASLSPTVTASDPCRCHGAARVSTETYSEPQWGLGLGSQPITGVMPTEFK